MAKLWRSVWQLTCFWSLANCAPSWMARCSPEGAEAVQEEVPRERIDRWCACGKR